MKVGSDLSQVILAKLDDDGVVEPISIGEYFGQEPGVLVGIPGAYTPICNNEHIPGIFNNRHELYSNGVSKIAFVSVDTPWVLREWRKNFLDDERIEFLSDSNRNLLKYSRLGMSAPEYGLSSVLERFTAVLRQGTVLRFRLEEDFLKTIMTSGESLRKDTKNLLAEI